MRWHVNVLPIYGPIEMLLHMRGSDSNRAQGRIYCGWSSLLCYIHDTFASILYQDNKNYTKTIALYVVKEITSHKTSRHLEPLLEGVCATCSGSGNRYFSSYRQGPWKKDHFAKGHPIFFFSNVYSLYGTGFTSHWSKFTSRRVRSSRRAKGSQDSR